MKPVDFKEANCVFGKNQDEYLALPTYKDKEGLVTSCWKLSFLEKIRILFTGKIFVTVMTFNQKLQPQKLSVKKYF